ncbi:hypothetical protein PTKIN_Ptkin09bG0013200 [Pterospermum kingtungense]
MADFAREMEDFKAANRTFGGDHQMKLETKASNQPSSNNSSTPNPKPNPHPQPQPLCLTTPSTCKNIDKYSRSYYNYNKSNVTWGVGDSEMQRQRRVLKYKSYAVEAKLKSSFVDGFRWMKNKCCQFVHGY